MNANRDRLIFFDTTLRDGEQSPGFSMTLEEKLRLAEALAQLGVDVIEAGFPAASPGDFAAVQRIAERIEGPTICGLSRCRQEDIDRSWQALQPSSRPRIHVFLATSPIHREHKLRLSRAEVLQRIRTGVQHARSLCADVEFSAEDAARTEPEFLAEAVAAAIECGARTINIPDTVGYALPGEFGALFRQLLDTVPGIEDAVLSCHCHDDLGLAVANSLAAVDAGARQVECTINGIGERAGNASLEELAMALRTRRDRIGLDHGLDTSRLVPTSQLLSRITGVAVQPNKAIVGVNAFAHEAGIHQHGVLAHSATYEIMRPEDVGLQGNSMVLGKHSGRHAVRHRLETLGHRLADPAFEHLFQQFKELADRKKAVLDADLEALAIGQLHPRGPWHLESLSTTAGTDTRSTATVALRHEDGSERIEAAVGDGPVDATFRAMQRATGETSIELLEYQVRSVTLGEDAQGQVTVHCQLENTPLRGQGVSTDIVEASAFAILESFNQAARRLEVSPS